MPSKRYTNFVPPLSPTNSSNKVVNILSGNEAQKMYLEEIKEARNRRPVCAIETKPHNRTKYQNESTSEKNLFLMAQSNDVDTLRAVLNTNPDKINELDNYGWSLLMIACQANSVEIAKELIDRGADTSIRDKAGNSARSLIIKSKNIALATILLSQNRKETDIKMEENSKVEQEYFCDTCKNRYSNRDNHLSSILHNINASRGKKIPTSYAIPESNRGYQIMLKVGWDKEAGLGPNGSGKRYPIKTVIKQDRKGFGHVKRKVENKCKEDLIKQKSRRRQDDESQKSRSMEINFRRQFY